MLANVWNRIIGWFTDRDERNKLVRSFNASSRDAFVLGEVPAMLEASISRGDPSYKHPFSKWMYSGFRIKVFTGRLLTKNEMLFIGRTILSNDQLVRRLVVLGWDTLEICGSNTTSGCKWKLADYMETINLLDNDY